MLLYILFCLLTVSAKSESEDVGLSCNGTEKERKGARVSGGTEVAMGIDEFPYLAQISVDGEIFCAGVIVNEHYILTAAHCVDNVTVDDVTVRVSSSVRNQGVTVELSDLGTHPGFDFPASNLDIAFLKTLRPFQFSARLKPAELAPIDSKLPRDVVLAGWGYDGINKGLRRKLRKATIPVVHNLRCQIAYPELLITENMFCTDNSRFGGIGACKGDGGSPATVAGTRTVVGLSSFTRGCGAGMSPSVFTNFQSRGVRDFIVYSTDVYK